MKRYIIRKYIIAASLIEAIKRDKKTAIDDIRIDEDWREDVIDTKYIGFYANGHKAISKKRKKAS